MTDESRIVQLIVRRLQNNLTAAEEEELRAWADQSSAHREFVDHRMQPKRVFSAAKALLKKDDEAIRRRVEQLCPGLTLSAKPVPVVTKFTSSVAAAITVSVLSIGSVLLTQGHHGEVQLRLKMAESRLRQMDYAADRASLRLGNGKTIFLDDTPEGVIWEEDGWQVLKGDSQNIIYAPGGKTSPEGKKNPGYHVFSSPFGQSWKLSFPGNSKIQLNTGSSLSYQVGKGDDIPGGGRDLVLYGEGWFEVSGNAQSPFTVSTAKAIVTSLSTSFDVKDYAHGKDFRATVVKGAINVSDGENTVHVNPGEAAKIDSGSSDLTKLTGFDTTKNLKWRSEYFDFTNLNVRESMQELAEWYGMNELVIYWGVDTVRHGEVKAGKIKKGWALEKLLKKLGNDHLYLWMEEKKIIASPIPEKYPY